MNLLITGVTGALGRRVAQRALDAGLGVRGISRREPRWATVPWHWVRADLASGDGVAAAVEGADVVIHAASDPKRQQEVDVEGTKHLIDAARRARVRHLLYVSIVGIDAIPFSYYQRKLEAERIVESSGIPFTIFRATQFHSFIDAILTALARAPLILPLPRGFKVQSVDVDEVAARIVRGVAAGPANGTVNFGGPEVLPLDQMAALWLSARKLRKRPLSLPVPGAISCAFVAGKNTAPEGERGTVRWRDWLTDEHPRDYGV